MDRWRSLKGFRFPAMAAETKAFFKVVFVSTAVAVVIMINVVLLYYYCFQECPKDEPVQEDFSSIAAIRESQYHASIHLNNVHFCSGAFIGTYFILTVAQCMHTFVNNQIEKSKLQVHLARREVPAYFRGGFYAVDNITVHPNFIAYRLAYNMAIVKLTEKVTEPYVRPITLPSSRMNIERTIVLVTGFRCYDAPDVRTVMTKSNMIIIEENTCNFAKTVDTLWKFCAIPSPRWKPCQTSRGGPAVSPDGILIGLYVMQNPEGCAKNLPELFVDVSKFMNFITNVIN